MSRIRALTPDMSKFSTLPAVLGAAAFFPTSAALAIQIILARSPADHASSVRIAAGMAATFEAVIFVTIPLVSLSYVALWHPNFGQKWIRWLWLAGGLGVCIAAIVTSIASVACLSRVDHDPLSTIVGWSAGDFLIGASIVLALASATQIFFFLSHLIVGRTPPPAPAPPRTVSVSESRPASRLKSIPYEKTAVSHKERGSKSFDFSTPPGSSSGRSAAETFYSIRTSISHAIRPMSSMTRLVSLSRVSSNNPSSSVLDLPIPPPEVRTHTSGGRDEEEGFDSWDTSAVAPETRRTVLGSSTPPPIQRRASRFLETIPASPASRSPSPFDPSATTTAASTVDMDDHIIPLEPPPRSAARRSRSYSPVSTRTIEAQRAAFAPPQQQDSEANIHPLFRSDSPLPPPSATPGTVVVAAPNGGQVLPASDRQSIRSIQSLRRLRSDSLPSNPSPLSRAQSCESFLLHRQQKMLHRRAESVLSPQIREEDDDGGESGEREQRPEEGPERKMTPPIPDWILAAGQRASLTQYHARRKSQLQQRQGEGKEKEAEKRPKTSS